MTMLTNERGEKINQSLVDILTDSQNSVQVEQENNNEFAINYAITHPDYYPRINDPEKNRQFRIDSKDKKILVIPYNAKGFWRDADKVPHYLVYDKSVKDALKEFHEKGYSFSHALSANDFVQSQYSNLHPMERLKKHTELLDSYKGCPYEHYIETEPTNIEKLF